MEITLIEGGPAIIKGDSIRLINKSLDGEVLGDIEITKEGSTATLALCRCGKSQKGTNCDGSHKIKREE